MTGLPTTPEAMRETAPERIWVTKIPYKVWHHCPLSGTQEYVRADHADRLSAAPVTVPDPIGAEWMRGQAISAYLDWPFGADSDENFTTVLRALPLPTSADLVAQAMQLPEIKRMADILEEVAEHPDESLPDCTCRGCRARAALRALAALTDGDAK